MSGQKIEDMKCKQCGYAHPVGSACPPNSSLPAPAGSAQRREITCPNCHAKVMDNGKRDEITQDWIAECVCGWWRSIVLPIAQDGDAPNDQALRLADASESATKKEKP